MTANKLDDPKFAKKLHAVLAILWLAFGLFGLFQYVTTSNPQKAIASSIPVLFFISVYANTAGHWSGWEAAGGEKDIEKIKSMLAKILKKL